MPKRRIPRKRTYKRDSKGRFASGGTSKTRTKIPRDKYHGKMATLYHLTTPQAAQAISETKTWIKPNSKISNGKTFFATTPNGSMMWGKVWKPKATSRISIRVRHKDIQKTLRDGWVTVDQKALQGKKIQKIETIKHSRWS